MIYYIRFEKIANFLPSKSVMNMFFNLDINQSCEGESIFFATLLESYYFR